jgi:hypothetical protein
MAKTEKPRAALASLLPPAYLDDGRVARCRFAHRGVLVFPTSVDNAIVYFAERGLQPTPVVPSVIVRRRLSDRYGIQFEACEVSITHLGAALSATGHNLEVFLFPLATANALEPRMVRDERRLGFENHLAFEVMTPDVPTLEGLLAALQQDAGLVFEGGGHNRHEDTTVFYFVREDWRTSSRSCGRFQRFELYCNGDFSTVIGRHPVDHRAVEGVYSNWTDLGRRFESSAA